ncbi:homocysteine-induced endoplasmic reticulum protein [Lycorma delicatula]|uniref:homocysteine-induced endoplasmic reticulum protein n=1 Tax=Lycorma delicatula TaxID=130591 RepID=UPI003F5156E6
MDGIEMPVTIVVKAPNQQIEDQTIHCELNWTIKRLKGYLSEVYPSKPRLEDQKLIYSGQLLVDSVQLKDVLRTYDGQENHTVHLVCSPPRDSFKSSSNVSSRNNPGSCVASTSSSASSVSVNSNTNSSNNSRTNNLNSRSTTHIQAETEPVIQTSRDDRRPGGDPRELWAAAAAAAATAYPNVGAYNGTNIAHQMAWMQQAYSQYMSHYMQFLASSQGASINNSATTAGMAYPTYNGFSVPGTTPLIGNGAAQQQNLPQNVNDMRPQQQPNVAAANNQQQPDDEEEGRGHRDWLDWFYIMSRVLVLFSIVYFYSSPVRFLMVSTLGMIMYLYQVGFFRMQGLEGARGDIAAANNNGNAANLAAAERENNNDRPNPAAGLAAAAANATINSNSEQQQDNDAPPPQVPPEPDRPSFLTLTWTILCSFLLSLIPEPPNVV